MSRLFDVATFEQQPRPTGADVDDTTLAAISERIVEARCLQQGLHVARPSADVRGVDLVVADARVQVKSTRRPYRRHPAGLDYYRFKAGNGDIGRFDLLALKCDIIAFYAHDTGWLWLLSSERVRQRWRGGRAHIRPDDREGRNDFGVFS